MWLVVAGCGYEGVHNAQASYHKGMEYDQQKSN
jgi:hypothetical protein